MIVSEYSTLRLMSDWEVPEKPHCSNCRFCLVSGDPKTPTVRCAKGQGKPGRTLQLWQVIRRMRPIQFRAAVNCPEFESMSGEGEDAL